MSSVTWMVLIDGGVVSVGSKTFPSAFSASSFAFDLRKHLEILNLMRSSWTVVYENMHGEKTTYEGKSTPCTMKS